VDWRIGSCGSNCNSHATDTQLLMSIGCNDLFDHLVGEREQLVGHG
jgi:hypothetical protein